MLGHWGVLSLKPIYRSCIAHNSPYRQLTQQFSFPPHWEPSKTNVEKSTKITSAEIAYATHIGLAVRRKLCSGIDPSGEICYCFFLFSLLFFLLPNSLSLSICFCVCTLFGWCALESSFDGSSVQVSQ